MLKGALSASGEDGQEVFRDDTIGELMEALLPCMLGAAPSGLSASTASEMLQRQQDDLKQAASGLLGTETVFFQLYTDFGALYDMVPFGRPLFATPLLPPLAQRYAPDYHKPLYDETAHVLAPYIHPSNVSSVEPSALSSGPPNRHGRSCVRCSVSSWAAHAYRSSTSCTGWRCTEYMVGPPRRPAERYCR